MNLLSHFVTAAPHSAAVQLGSVLPDLLRLFGKRTRPHTLVKYWGEQDNPPSDILGVLEGLGHHQLVDSLFHRDRLFTRNARSLRVALEKADRGGGQKRFFSAHILTEIYCDHLLLLDRPNLGGEFDRLLLREKDGLLLRLLAPIPDISRSAWQDFIARVLADRFWNDYQALEGIFFRTNRILSRLGQRNLDETEISVVTLYFEENRESIWKELSGFIESVQKRERRALAPGGAVLPEGCECARTNP